MLENFSKGKEGTSERQAEDILRGVKTDYANRDKQAWREIEEQPSVKEQVSLLRSTHAELERLQDEIQKKVMGGSLRSSDTEAEIEMKKLLAEADGKVHHTLAQPEEPFRVEMLQENWENAGEKLQREHIRPTEQMHAALSGETTVEQAGQAVKDRHELKQIGSVLENRENMDAGEVSGLKDNVSVALSRLNELQPRIEALAKEKALSPEEKEQKLEQYRDEYDKYEKLREEVRGLLERVRKA